MKELFCINAGFFLPARRKLQRDRQNAEKIQDGFRPGIPQRTQQRREKHKGADRAEQHREKGVQRQPARVHTEGEKEDGKPCRERVKHIEQFCRSGRTKPQSAQQIIEQRKRAAQRKGDEQRTELCRIVNPHGFSRRAAGKVPVPPGRFRS